MTDRVVLRDELRQVLGGVTTECVRQWIKKGRLPAPDIMISRRTVGWKASTLREAGIALADTVSTDDHSS